ncbi:MAG: hypothetical protein BWY50_02074 [Spirochaetes bacterium ADurb.Bin315]|nr:MAG: hypothetical protein BWY50_02074 [Spirochaetes bacterium ADurb.Bin315]
MIGQGADEGDLPIFLQREEILIFQQDKGLLSDLNGKGVMFIAVELKTFFIDIGVVEDPLTILLGKNHHDRSIALFGGVFYRRLPDGT